MLSIIGINTSKSNMSKNCDEDVEDNCEKEEESPILREIPVFLSQCLAEKLVLYQYPLEQSGLSIENSTVIQCSIKQNPHEIKLELERNTNCPNYSLSRGEQIAINVDGKDSFKKNPEDVTFPRQLMDKQVFVSRTLAEQNFAVGVLHDNEIHLTPLKTVALLRPSFEYIDKGDKRLKKESKDADGDTSLDEDEALKQITVKFAKQESEKKQESQREIIWMEFCKLYCTKHDDRAKEIMMDTNEILQAACNFNENKKNSSSHGDSLSNLQTLPITEKVKKLLCQARLIHFSQLIKHLGNACDIQDYLKVVQQVAVSVQGCWVVKSDIIFNKEIMFGGVTGNLMRAARDYILYLFTKNRTITRQKILEIVKLPSNLIKEILEEFAVAVPSSREWEFMLLTDHEFIKTYPEVSQRQYIKWEMKHEQLIESFKNTENNLGGCSPAKHRRKSYRDSSFSSDNESGAENRKNTYQISGHKVRRTKKQSISISDTNCKTENT